MNQAKIPQFKTIPGRWVVLAMLAFGIIATGSLWIYSKFDLAPFLPLRKALYEEFPKSHPDVRGGRTRGSPPKLRIVMQVDFPPSETDERVERIVARVIALAKRHADLRPYETLELFLVQYVPEKNSERIRIERKIADL